MVLSMAMGAAFVAASAPPTGVEVTVYNQGFGFVKEIRTLGLRQGAQTVAIENVAAQIEPASVGVRGLDRPDAFQVLEQNYQYDLISPLAILNKSVGQRVRFIRTMGGARDTLEGVLISAPTAIVGDPGGGSSQTYNGMVIRTDDGRIVLNPSGEIEVATVPAGLISKPTLLWEIQSALSGESRIELSYLTRGLVWSADYVLTLGPEDRADLLGWVTLNNTSGIAYENARLKLLAGDVERPAQEMMRGNLGGRAALKAEPAFAEEALFEYHLYTLQRPTTLRDREMKQVSLLESKGLRFTKRLIVDALQGFGRIYPNEGEVGLGTIKPQVRIEFENTQANALGMALPKGRIKVYQRDQSGSVQMLGEDQIDHTPKNEKVSLAIGRAFDVRAERKRTAFRRLSDRSTEETFEIELRNRKEVAETVTVLERHSGDWRITESNLDYRKLDANTTEWVVPLKAGEVRTLRYTRFTSW